MSKSPLCTPFENTLLKTDRIRLSLFTEDKTDLLFNHMFASIPNDGEIRQLMRAKFEKSLAEDSILLFLIYNEDDDFIGYIELKDLNDIPEIGLDLAEKFRSKGYGYEACKLLLGKAFDVTDSEYIQYNVFQYNEASIALAKKLGGIFIGNRSTFEALKKADDVSEDIKKNAEQFDMLQYRIYKNDFKNE